MVLKSERTGVEAQFYDLCTKVVCEEGYELYDLEYFPRNQELRIFIMDKETGSAVIEDCVKIDHALTPYIDELEWMPDQLRLEVSSPGVFRNLSSIEHFQSAVGELVELVLTKKLMSEEYDDLPRSLVGEKKIRVVLNQVNENEIQVSLADYSLNIKFENIKKACLSPDF